MTLGNTPQPLTRRQLRELASEHGVSTSAIEIELASASALADSSAAVQARESSGESSFTELIQKAEAAAKTAAVPRLGERRDSKVSVSDDDYLDSLDRTLTRRELRALQASQDSANDAPDVEAGAPVVTVVETIVTTAVVDTELVDSELVDIELVDIEVERDASVLVVVDDDAPRELHPPVGHWSIDPDEVEAGSEHIHTIELGQPFDQIIARGIGSGGVPTTTNALILPDMAHQDRVSGPLVSTGEIMITGSIDLPRSLGSTGAHPDRFDSSDVDNMLDQLDESGAGSDVAPVSASRAVSSHSSTRGVMTPPKKEIVWLPMVLAITAAALALGVVALFVGAFVFNIF